MNSFRAVTETIKREGGDIRQVHVYYVESILDPNSELWLGFGSQQEMSDGTKRLYIEVGIGENSLNSTSAITFSWDTMMNMVVDYFNEQDGIKLTDEREWKIEHIHIF